MILDGEQVVEGVSKGFVKYPGEEHSAWLLRLSHLHCQNQGITKISDLTSCANLTVLYLYNNKLKCIEALESAPHIQLLYLQNNKITRMSGFDKLKKLRKLYLTRNKIQVLEGLVENKALEELHVDRQLLRPGEHFVMDPRTCQAMANCLKSLNISGSNCHDLAGLHLMTALQSLSAANNHIALLDPVVEVVTNLSMLTSLDLTNNPKLNKLPMYRTLLIATGRSLALLDGRRVEQSNRLLAQQITYKRSQSASRGPRHSPASYCQESGDETSESNDHE